MAALAMAGAMFVLWLMDDPNIWVGAIAGLGAIAVRGWYMLSEEMTAVWELDANALHGPAERHVPLARIARLRRIGSFVQIITDGGDKHLIKFQSDPNATIETIERARA
nr:hypothetical protein [Pontibaca salina]